MGIRTRNRFLVTTALVSTSLASATAANAQTAYGLEFHGTATSYSNPASTTVTGTKSGAWIDYDGFALTNAGTLIGNGTLDSPTQLPDAGVLVTTGSASITNSGTITGKAMGIGTALYYNPVTQALEIRATNTAVTNLAGGTITGEATNAVRLIGGGTVTNAGTITSLGASAVSMYAFGGQNTAGQTSIGTVTNQAGGVITGATRGVVLTGGGTVANAGTIGGGTAAGDGSNAAIIIQAQASETGKVGTVTNSGLLSGWRGVYMAGSLASSEIVNSGTVTGTGNSGVFNGSAGLLTVRNNAGGTIAGATSGVFANTAGVAVINAGTIRGNGSYDGFNAAPDAGVAIAAAGSTIVNSGTISGAGLGITTLYYLNGNNELEPLAIGTAVTNSGTITGENNDGIRLIGGGTVTNSGTIQGVTEAGFGTDGVSMFAFNGQNTSNQTSIGTIANNAGGTISGARFGALLSGGGVIGNAGTMTGNAGAIIIQAASSETGKTAKVTNSGTMTGGDAVSIAGNIASSELTNSGRIEGTTALGVDNTSAGLLTVQNQAGGEIVGAKSGISATLAAVAVNNAGTIRGNGTSDSIDFPPDAGVIIAQAGSSVTNSGTISGANAGISTYYHYNQTANALEGRAIGTVVTNSGTITGERNDGVRLIGGGTVTNSGTISGVAEVGSGTDGVSMYAFNGQDLRGRTGIGSIINQAGGTISGARFGAAVTSGGGIIENAGTIAGNAGGTYIRAFGYEPGKTGSLTNSGTIKGADGALFVGSLASATVDNSGRIEATGSAAGVGYGIQNASLGTVTVTNRAGGEISGTKSAIWAEQGAVVVNNAGTIRGNGSYDGFDAPPDAGIVISQANSSITNSGTISGAGAGITTANFFDSATSRLEGRAIGTVVSNSGSIIGESNDGVRLLGGGTVTNSGLIRGAAGSLTDGIQMSNLIGQNTAGQAAIGTVTNQAGGLVEGQRWGVFLVGGGTVVNAGTITGAKLASASNGVGGILIATGSGQSGKTASVTNSGTVNGLVELTTSRNTFENSGTVNANVNLGTGAEAVTGSSTFTNRGTVNGNVTFGAGDDFYNFIAGATQTGTVDGGAGFDTLSLLFGNVAQPQRVDGSKFINFEKLVQNHQGTISLFFSGAQTFNVVAADQGGSIELNNGTVDSVAVGSGSTAELGSQVTVSATDPGATAVAITGDSGAVSSAGTIQASGADATAVALTGDTSTFANSGTVVASGDGATAVAASGEAAEVVNTGTITTSGSNATAVNLAGDAATITSAPGATIATTGDNSVAVAVNGASATVANSEGATIATQGDNSVAVVVASTSATVQNDGTLVTSGANSDGMSLASSGGTVNNTSHNTIRTTGANSDGIEIAGTDNALNNTGTIRVTGAGSAAVNVVGAAGSGNRIDNRTGGIIVAAGDAIRGGDGDETVVNAGAITGDIRLGGGNDTLVLAGGTLDGVADGGAGRDTLAYQITGNSTLAGFSGFESLTKTGGGTLTIDRDVTGFTDVTVSEGRLHLAGGTLGGATTLGAGARLTGNGRIAGNLAVSGIVAPGNSIGTVTVAGGVNFAQGSRLEVETNAAGASDRVAATGAASIAGGTVVVLPEAGSYGKVTSYGILSAASVDGRFSAVTSSNASLVPYLTYGPASVTLTLARADLSFAAIAQSANQGAVATAVEALGRGNALYDAVILQPTEAGGRAAFDALSGELYASVPTALIDESRVTREAFLGRTRSRGQATGYAVWGTGFGGWAESGGDNGVAEIDVERRGILAGIEASLATGLRLGVGAGYADSRIDADARASRADVTTRLVGVFAGWNGDGPSVRAGASIAWHDIDAERSLSFPNFAASTTSEYDGRTTQIFGELGYPIVAGNVSFEPFAGIAHVRTRTDALTERGSATAGLSVAREKRNASFASLGLRLTGEAALSAGTTFLPRIGVAYTHGWGDLGGATAASLPGATQRFAVSGARLGGDSFSLEGGFDIAVGERLKLGASYSGMSGGDWADRVAKVSVSFAF